jgi:hypothetical protein
MTVHQSAETGNGAVKCVFASAAAEGVAMNDAACKTSPRAR